MKQRQSKFKIFVKKAARNRNGGGMEKRRAGNGFAGGPGMVPEENSGRALVGLFL